MEYNVDDQTLGEYVKTDREGTSMFLIAFPISWDLKVGISSVTLDGQSLLVRA
jgi:hypothetical protein